MAVMPTIRAMSSGRGSSFSAASMLLSDMVLTVIECGKKKGLTISEQEIAEKLNTSQKMLEAYLNDGSETPGDLVALLESANRDLIGNFRRIKVEWIIEEDDYDDEDEIWL